MRLVHRCMEFPSEGASTLPAAEGGRLLLSSGGRSIIALERAGWAVLVIWECETKDIEAVIARLDAFLRGGTSSGVSST